MKKTVALLLGMGFAVLLWVLESQTGVAAQNENQNESAVDRESRLLRLNQIEYERLSGTRLPASPVGYPSVVEFSGRKVIKDEIVAYIESGFVFLEGTL